jgi:hypothetical protein
MTMNKQCRMYSQVRLLLPAMLIAALVQGRAAQYARDRRRVD